jgi:glycerophosphoryl diester phosphodiesterase
MDVDVLGVHIGSFGQEAQTGLVDRDAVRRTVEIVHGCRRELLVWCPDVDTARTLVTMGTDAVVVDEVPSVLRALGQDPAHP